jgi:trk system potassium uptake protein TrkH
MLSLLVVGMLVFVAGEVQGGRVLEGRGAADLIANAFFLSVNRTTGMSTVDMSALQDANVMLLLVLMYIGGSSTSTAGGIKIGAFMVSLVVIASALRGHGRAQVFAREIPQATVLRATAVALLGGAMLAAGVWLIEVTDDEPFLALVFEVMSALANVGWSQGITEQLSTAGSMVLVLMMFVGRLGPLIVALSIPDRPQDRYQYAYGTVRIG